MIAWGITYTSIFIHACICTFCIHATMYVAAPVVFVVVVVVVGGGGGGVVGVV